jgi:hypothetical protein
VVDIPFFAIEVEVKDIKTGIPLVKESHIAYVERYVVDDIVDEFTRLLGASFDIEVERKNDGAVIKIPGRCTTATIYILRPQVPKHTENKCRACYPSEAFEHIRRNVGVDEIIRDVVDEIDRYHVPD